MPNLRRLGRDGEDSAAEFLIAKGFTIITRRFATRHGEIDLIALDGDELVFVEVKLRYHPDYTPEEAVGTRKLANLRRAADAYLLGAEEQNRPHRFDLVAITPDEIRHYVRAFV